MPRMFKAFAFTGALFASAAGTPAIAQNWQVRTQANASTETYTATQRTFTSQNDTECNGSCPAGSAWTRSSPTKTYAASEAHVSGYFYGYGDPHYAGSIQADGFASADLATGELKISDGSFGAADNQTSTGAMALFNDRIQFNNPFSTAVTATVKVHVDGTFLGYQQPNLSFNLGSSLLYLYWYDPSSTVPACIIATDSCANVAQLAGNVTTTNWTALTPGDWVTSFTITPDDPILSLGMSLSAGGPSNSWAAFQHTAGISFDLPDGVSFTSASGVFLTAQDAPAVPEPATWATMIAGFALLGAALRRRRTVAALA